MCAYFIDISQGGVEMLFGYVIITLLQIVCRVCQSKNFENRSIIGKDMDKSKVPRFLAHPVHVEHVWGVESMSVFCRLCSLSGLQKLMDLILISVWKLIG